MILIVLFVCAAVCQCTAALREGISEQELIYSAIQSAGYAVDIFAWVEAQKLTSRAFEKLCQDFPEQLYDGRDHNALQKRLDESGFSGAEAKSYAAVMKELWLMLPETRFDRAKASSEVVKLAEHYAALVKNALLSVKDEDPRKREGALEKVMGDLIKGIAFFAYAHVRSTMPTQVQFEELVDSSKLLPFTRTGLRSHGLWVHPDVVRHPKNPQTHFIASPLDYMRWQFFSVLCNSETWRTQAIPPLFFWIQCCYALLTGDSGIKAVLSPGGRADYDEDLWMYVGKSVGDLRKKGDKVRYDGERNWDELLEVFGYPQGVSSVGKALSRGLYDRESREVLLRCCTWALPFVWFGKQLAKRDDWAQRDFVHQEKNVLVALLMQCAAADNFVGVQSLADIWALKPGLLTSQQMHFLLPAKKKQEKEAIPQDCLDYILNDKVWSMLPKEAGLEDGLEKVFAEMWYTELAKICRECAAKGVDGLEHLMRVFSAGLTDLLEKEPASKVEFALSMLVRLLGPGLTPVKFSNKTPSDATAQEVLNNIERALQGYVVQAFKVTSFDQFQDESSEALSRVLRFMFPGHAANVSVYEKRKIRGSQKMQNLQVSSDLDALPRDEGEDSSGFKTLESALEAVGIFKRNVANPRSVLRAKIF